MAENRAIRKNGPKRVIKDRALTNLVIANRGNLSETARQLGISRQAVQERFNSPSVQLLLRAIMEKADITEAFLAKRIKEGLEAKETRFFQHDGKTVTTRDVADHLTRHKYLVTALKLYGYLK